MGVDFPDYITSKGFVPIHESAEFQLFFGS